MGYEKTPDVAYCCAKCGSFDIQISLPAWHAPNKDWEYVETDIEADPQYSYCLKCEYSDFTVIDENHKRWGEYLTWRRSQGLPVEPSSEG